MAQPTPYVKSQTFADIQSGNTLAPIPGADFDVEFSLVQATLTQTLANLKVLQRDDGALANGIVTPDTLSTATQALIAGWVPRGAWITARTYAVKDMVTQNSNSYVCITAHTSGVFATDLAAGKWQALFYSVAASSISVTPGGNLVSTDVQSALIELDTDLSTEIAARAAAITSLTTTVNANNAAVTSTVVPLTTRGDTLIRGASANARLGVGAAGQVIGTDGIDVMWVATTGATTVTTTQSANDNSTKLASTAYVDRVGLKSTVYTTPGANTFTPVKTGLYKITLVGGGNTGGTGAPAGNPSGGGGGAGATCIKWATLTAGTGYVVTVGAAATATTAVVGATTYTAGAGSAGANGPGGAGGTATNGDINISGGDGFPSGTSDGAGLNLASYGAGGVSSMGGGSAKAYGSGGNGGLNAAGSAGKQGVAIIESIG